MSRRPFRLVLVVLLASGVGLATEAVTASVAGAGQASSVPAKKKHKQKPTVKLGDSTFGKVLVDAKTGRTLYAFMPDGTDTTASKCTAGCATIWPPETAKKAVAGKGLTKAKLTLGGGKQLAYADHLLYMFSGDKKAGDTNGQGFANIWHMLNAKGELITA